MIAATPIALERGSEPFPGYRLRSHLGQGAFSEVWSADTPDGLRVALKFLKTDQQRATVKEIKALQAIRQLDHPHLLHIEQVWCLPGYIVIAMELAEGTLADLLEIYQTEFGSPISPAHCCEMLGQAASALDFLNAPVHQINGAKVAFLHCDIKPSNLFIFGDRLKVGDFGLAVALGLGANYLRPVGGTPDYAAPEVGQGRLSRFLDQYALAVSYCEMRLGRLPFRDRSESLRSLGDRTSLDLSGLTPAERPVVARALDAVPDRRWPSCTEFLSHLTRAIHGKSMGSRGRIRITPTPGSTPLRRGD